MSLPREWNLQDSQGSLYCASEPDSIRRIDAGGLIRTMPGGNCIIQSPSGSQPTESVLLAECKQDGSLFSIHSAPPIPLADFCITQQTDNLLGVGCSEKTDKIGTISGLCIDLPQRPASLAVDIICHPSPRTLHASLLEHQISEIEEDDNENMLTVSSITARPLIAKSRELRTNRWTERTQKENELQNRFAKALPSSSTIAEPPDGGYGWCIVFGAFFVQFWVAGLVKSYGVLYVEIMETFPSTSATVASWIPAILSALCLALAPLSSALCQRFSCRTVVFIGGLFCAFGLTLSYFATSLLHLLFTFGILTGIGGGLSTTPGIVIVSQYFGKHRALANGICVSGTAAGSFILPVLIKHLVDNYGFHGTILILGGCMLHVCVSATLYKPLIIQDVDESKLNTQSINDECTKSLSELNNPSNAALLTHSTYLDTCDETFDKNIIEHLFLEESKNCFNDIYNKNKFGNNNEKNVGNDNNSDDECKDIVGETTFMKPIKSVRSSGILHSVEDLSTDSTWVYRKHSSGTDSNRGSRRRRNVFNNDELITKIQEHLVKPINVNSPNQPINSTNRGLSKSMDIPTSVSNFGLTKDDDEEETENSSRTCCDRIRLYLDISLLKDPTFILMCLSVTLMSVGCPYMLYYLPAHVISIGYNKSEAGYLVAVSAALDLIGRLGLGWLSDLQLFDRKKTYIVCILGAGTAVLTIPLAHSFYLLGISAAMYGLCLGCWYVLMPVLLADIFGTDRISSSYGLVRMFQSIGAISVPPLAGLLRDMTGNYKICFYCMGSCMVLGSIPLIVSAILNHRGIIVSSTQDDILIQ